VASPYALQRSPDPAVCRRGFCRLKIRSQVIQVGVRLSYQHLRTFHPLFSPRPQQDREKYTASLNRNCTATSYRSIFRVCSCISRRKESERHPLREQTHESLLTPLLLFKEITVRPEGSPAFDRRSSREVVSSHLPEYLQRGRKTLFGGPYSPVLPG